MTVFSERLEKERMARGWSQPELGERIGTSQQNVQRWTSGANLPTRAFLIPIANAFSQKPGDWLELWNEATLEEAEAAAKSAGLSDRQRDREIEKLRKEIRRLSARVEKLAQQ